MGEEMFTISSAMSDSGEFDLQPKLDSPYTPHKVDKMRRHLRFFFMTPCEKYKARRRKPWKLIVQTLKIVIVTIQVFTLGTERLDFVNYEHRTKLALQHLLFNKWDPAYETLPYPPATGQYALYKRPDLEEHINYAMNMYNQTTEVAIGAYGYPNWQQNFTSKSAHLKLSFFKVGNIFPNNVTYDLNPNIDSAYFNLTAVKVENGTEVYDVVEFLKRHGHNLSIHRLHSIELSFALNGIHINSADKLNAISDPDCLAINATAFYDNTDHDGQMLVDMKVHLTPIGCYDGSTYELDNDVQLAFIMILDSVVILCCAISLITCVRSLSKSFRLGLKSRKFFSKHYGYKFKSEDVWLFVSLWFVMSVISDVLTIVGTAYKFLISAHHYEYYDQATSLLGVSIILIWMGVMRYFEYFKKYNVLVVTCKKALPDVLRFLICASIFYLAFTIAGWLVLGPYHVKFASIATASECLFSLVNGDDMFVTFSVIDKKAPIGIWYFSRVYLYSFISLFIYFVLNVFISVIIDTYEVVKRHYNNELSRTVVEKFMESCMDDPTSPLYISDVQRRGCTISSCCGLFSCCRRCSDADDVDLLA